MRGLLNIPDVFDRVHGVHDGGVEAVESVENKKRRVRPLFDFGDGVGTVETAESVQPVKSVESVECVESPQAVVLQIHPDTYRILLIATHNLLSMADDLSTVTERNLLSMAAALNDHLVNVVGRTKRGA